MQVAVSRTADDEYCAENHDGIGNKINNKCGINIYKIIKIFIVIYINVNVEFYFIFLFVSMLLYTLSIG